MRQSLAQQEPSQVHGGVESADPTARQPYAQQRPQLDRGPRSQLTQRNQRNPQTATRSQPHVQQASLSLDRRSGNNVQGTRTTGGQLAATQAQQQQQLGRGALSYTRSIGSTSGQLVQRQPQLDNQGANNEQTVVTAYGQPSAQPQQFVDLGGFRNDHLPSATPLPPALSGRSEQQDVSDGQHAYTANGPTPTPQHQQGQLKRKQPGSEQPQRRIRQQVPGPMAPPPRPKMNVDDFPEVPRVEKIQRHLRVTYNGMEVAESLGGFWVLQQYRPPGSFCTTKSIDCHAGY